MPTHIKVDRPAYLAAPAGALSIHLDALRGTAAIGVLASHWRDTFFVNYPQIPHPTPWQQAAYFATGLGHQWVVVFFVLSGYLVGGSVVRKAQALRWSWSEYLFDRFTRLYAVLIPALFLGGFFDWLGLHLFGATGIYGGQKGAHAFAPHVAAHLTASVLLGNLCFLQAIHFPTFGSNGPLWSLSYEFSYYVACPLVLLTFCKSCSLLQRAVNACLGMLWIYLGGRDVFVLGLIWWMGACLHLVPQLRLKTEALRTTARVLGIGVMLSTLGWCKQADYRAIGFSHFVPSDLLLGIITATLVYLVFSSPEASVPRQYQRLAQAIARSSYTLYLVHVPAFVFLAAWIAQPRWRPEGRHLFVGVGILFLVFLYAQLVYMCFERNTHTLRIWLKVRLFAAPASRPLPIVVPISRAGMSRGISLP